MVDRLFFSVCFNWLNCCGFWFYMIDWRLVFWFICRFEINFHGLFACTCRVFRFLFDLYHFIVDSRFYLFIASQTIKETHTSLLPELSQQYTCTTLNVSRETIKVISKTRSETIHLALISERHVISLLITLQAISAGIPYNHSSKRAFLGLAFKTWKLDFWLSYLFERKDTALILTGKRKRAIACQLHSHDMLHTKRISKLVFFNVRLITNQHAII